MASERDRTLEALRTAVQMEIDGKAFYLKASQASSNEMGRKLLESLSSEEDLHRQKFEAIYQAIQSKQGWPDVSLEAGRAETIQTMFAEAAKQIGVTKPGTSTEMEAIETAMEMENRSYDLYTSRSRETDYSAEKKFYESVAAEESVHHRLLSDYYEYLKDPVQWFTAKEHPSLDGG